MKRLAIFLLLVSALHARAEGIPRPTEVYPANCRLWNLHVTWTDPRAPRKDELRIE